MASSLDLQPYLNEEVLSSEVQECLNSSLDEANYFISYFDFTQLRVFLLIG